MTASTYAATVRAFGASLRRLRERKGWSVEVFAKRLGMSPRRVSAIEAGRAQVTLTDIVNIGEKLGRRAGLVVRPLKVQTRKAGKKGQKRERRTC